MTIETIIERWNDPTWISLNKCTFFNQADPSMDGEPLMSPVAHMAHTNHPLNRDEEQELLNMKAFLYGIPTHDWDDANAEMLIAIISEKPGKKGPKKSPGS